MYLLFMDIISFSAFSSKWGIIDELPELNSYETEHRRRPNGDLDEIMT